MLQTKLYIPSIGNNIIHRTELFEKLNQGLSRKLTLISAPAGYGKTSLIGDWIDQNRIPTAWFSIDKGDNDPVEFLSYIISAIQGIRNEFGKAALKLLNSPNKPGNESIIGLLINEILGIEQNFLLVFDDFHLITNTDILELISYFINHLPANIHLAILTRSDPALPFARLRSQQQLVELRLADLGFTANEISHLFNKKLKLGLTVEDIYSLESKTEGWIAGLQLTALSLKNREDISAFIKMFVVDNQYIMDYLIEEVLKVQTDEIKEFLLQTSILEQMSGPLCDALLNKNDSQHILEQLEKSNMFIVPLDTDQKWYRYHHLFARLLTKRLLTKGKSAVESLHNKASDCFEQNGMYDLAIEHALEIKNYEKSILLISGIVESLWKNGQHAAILTYGELLPDEIILKNADFCLYYSWILIIAGQIQKAEPYLLGADKIAKEKIEVKNASETDVLYHKKLLGKISVAFAYQASFTAPSQKNIEYCKTAMEYLSDDDPLWFSWGWYSIGTTQMLFENFAECIESYEKALTYGKKSGNVYLISTIAINLAYLESRMGLYTSSLKKCSDLIHFMKGSGYSHITKSEWNYAGLYSCMAGIQCMRTDFDEAWENIKIAYHLSAKDSNNSFKTIVLLVYSLILYGRGDLDGVMEMLGETDKIIQNNKIAKGAMSIYIAMKGFMYLEKGELDAAHEFFQENDMGINNNISYLDEHGYAPYVLLLITELRFEEAERLLSKIFKMASSANRIERMIELKILYALLFKTKGNREKAIANLIESLELAASENILMSYILFQDRIGDLLPDVYKYQATTKTRIPKNTITRLKSALEKREKLKKIKEVSELSSREMDTLKLIGQNRTNQQIADKLFISLNTVKTHIKNILFKLEVDERQKAVIKAKEKGII